MDNYKEGSEAHRVWKAVRGKFLFQSERSSWDWTPELNLKIGVEIKDSITGKENCRWKRGKRTCFIWGEVGPTGAQGVSQGKQQRDKESWEQSRPGSQKALNTLLGIWTSP